MILAAIPLFLWDFSASDGGLVEQGDTLQWEWGQPSVGPVAVGPAWATRLDADYLNEATDTLEIPLGDFSGAERPIVVIDHWYDIAVGDAAWFEIDRGNGFEWVEPVYGYPQGTGFVGQSSGPISSAVDLRLEPVTSRLRLVFSSDSVSSAPGWYVHQAALYDGDPVPPQVSVAVPLADTQLVDEPYIVSIEVVDDTSVVDVWLDWSSDRGDGGSVPGLLTTANTYEAEIPPVGPGTTVSFSVRASDAQQTAVQPAAGLYSYRSFLAGPTGLVGEGGTHAVAPDARLSWTPPTSPHQVLLYEVLDGTGAVVATTTETSVVLSLDAEQDPVFRVRAQYDVGVSDPSPVLELDVSVAFIEPLVPDQAFGGDERWLSLQGENLTLVSGLTTADLGPGMTVSELRVDDANSGALRVSIVAGAATGLRTLTLTRGEGDSAVVLRFSEAFEVLNDGDAPRLAVSPGIMEQADVGTLELVPTEPFATEQEMSVDVGEDIVITGPIELADDGQKLSIPVAINGRARIGSHTILVDDGARLWSVGLVVDEYNAPATKQCGVGAGTPSGAASLAMLMWFGRRRRQRTV